MHLAHIAVLDDEADITLLLATYLRGHGYRVTELQRGAALMELMAHDTPALVLLDLGLPGEDGLAIARRLRDMSREISPSTPALGLVIVTGRGDAVDKVVGLEIGADDYITKPFDLRELLARVKAVLRRTARSTADISPSSGRHDAPPAGAAKPAREQWRFAGYTLDAAARRLNNVDGNEVALTTGEFELLMVFVQHPARVLSRDFLLEQSRGRDAAPFDRTIDVQIGRLRKKLEHNAQDPQILKSVRGAGYIMAAAVAAAVAAPVTTAAIAPTASAPPPR